LPYLHIWNTVSLSPSGPSLDDRGSRGSGAGTSEHPAATPNDCCLYRTSSGTCELLLYDIHSRHDCQKPLWFERGQWLRCVNTLGALLLLIEEYALQKFMCNNSSAGIARLREQYQYKHAVPIHQRRRKICLECCTLCGVAFYRSTNSRTTTHLFHRPIPLELRVRHCAVTFRPFRRKTSDREFHACWTALMSGVSLS
jgi:hypothetical protein